MMRLAERVFLSDYLVITIQLLFLKQESNWMHLTLTLDQSLGMSIGIGNSTETAAIHHR